MDYVLQCLKNSRLESDRVPLMQKNRHFVKIEEACGGSRNFFSPRPCRQIDESICKDVSVWITVLRGSVSPAQHIISGRLQVMCSF